MKEFWNQRYSIKEFVYGTEPNEFFRQSIDKIPPGKILLPGEGEGRNGVYAASRGWQVDAFDLSEKGRTKALMLAKQRNLQLKYYIAEYNTVILPDNEYDLIALIYCHMNTQIRGKVHQKLISSLKRGGIIILEAFSKEQIAKDSGGPKDINMLFSLSELRKDFQSLKIEYFEKLPVDLDSGSFHKGEASIIRMFAIKE